MRNLMDTDGENRAVRAFLMHYGAPGLSVGQMKAKLRMAGWNGCWPAWCDEQGEDKEHLTKAGAQLWLRHLFALESAASVAGSFTVDNPCACGAYGGPDSHTKSCRYTAGAVASDPLSGIDRYEWETDGMEMGPQGPWVRLADVREHLADGVPGTPAMPDTCDGLEQEAFEQHLRDSRLSTETHPLHYLFLDPKSNAARQAWKAAILYCRRVVGTAGVPACAPTEPKGGA